MNKPYLFAIIFIILAVIFFALAVFYKPSVQQPDIQMQPQNHPTITLGGETFNLELAITPAERAQGLSGREPLLENEGMLFVFDEPSIHGFWMKDMKFALDIIWIKDNKVVDIWQDASPPMGDDIPRYRPEAESDYVLEVNAGFVERSGLKIGDEVSIDLN
jgi:hypothetical protein